VVSSVTGVKDLLRRIGASSPKVSGFFWKADVKNQRQWVRSSPGIRRRQVCWAPLPRDFQALIARGGESAEVGQRLLGPSERLFDG
jgi:hypothetical protein